MAAAGPIIIVEDDIDDQRMLDDVFKEINIYNNVIKFTDAEKAFEYLKNSAEQPFIILSDVNLPGLSGIEFKRRIDNDKELRKKSIPFVFVSTSTEQKAVNEAYTKMTVQGFFKKPNTYKELLEMISLIVSYWKLCHHPNT